MATPRSSARSELIEMLTQDHKRAKKAFRDFEKLDAQRDTEACAELVARTCAELTLHATLEEELFYPALRGALDETKLIDEAEVEHRSAKDLIEKLRQMSPGDDKYAATFTVLGEYIKHHIKEEEGEMFPQLARSKRVDWQALCDEMVSRRAELEDELLPDDTAPAVQRAAAPRGTRRVEAERPQAAADEDEE